jgi:hypothetical protein
VLRVTADQLATQFDTETSQLHPLNVDIRNRAGIGGLPRRAAGVRRTFCTSPYLLRDAVTVASKSDEM